MDGIVILLVITVVYALLAGRLDRWSISGPMVFVATGLALSPHGAGLLELSLDNEVVLTFTQFTSLPCCSPSRQRVLCARRG